MVDVDQTELEERSEFVIVYGLGNEKGEELKIYLSEN